MLIIEDKMFRLIKNALKKKSFAAVGSLFLCSTTIVNLIDDASGTPTIQTSKTDTYKSWKKFHSVTGTCAVVFPESPEHLRQMMPIADNDKKLQYDVYVSALEKQAIFMLLVAEYPSHIDQKYAGLSLETFLNGILTQNSNSRLLFADLIEIKGYKALDFFILTKGVYFKGRAIMAKNNLYLLAMECEVKNYQQGAYNHFIESFEIK